VKWTQCDKTQTEVFNIAFQEQNAYSYRRNAPPIRLRLTAQYNSVLIDGCSVRRLNIWRVFVRNRKHVSLRVPQAFYCNV